MATINRKCKMRSALCLVASLLTGCGSVPFTPLTPDDFWKKEGFSPAAVVPNPEDMACKMLKASVCAYSVDSLIDRDGSLPLDAGDGKPAFCPLLPDLHVAKGVINTSSDSSSDRRDAGFIALLSNSEHRAIPRIKRPQSS